VFVYGIISPFVLATETCFFICFSFYSNHRFYFKYCQLSFLSLLFPFINWCFASASLFLDHRTLSLKGEKKRSIYIWLSTQIVWIDQSQTNNKNTMRYFFSCKRLNVLEMIWRRCIRLFNSWNEYEDISTIRSDQIRSDQIKSDKISSKHSCEERVEYFVGFDSFTFNGFKFFGRECVTVCNNQFFIEFGFSWSIEFAIEKFGSGIEKFCRFKAFHILVLCIVL
jgi:hypothetical protein